VNLTGIVLAGGKGTRYGFNKLKIKAGPVPLFIDQIFKLNFFCSEILVCTSKSNYPVIFSEISKIRSYQKKYNFEKMDSLKINAGNFFKKALKPPDVRIILDKHNFSDLNKDHLMQVLRNPKNKGPVIGIYTGLLYARYLYSIVVAFDMPFISYNLLNLLINISGLNHKKSGSSKPVSLYHKRTEGKAVYVIKTGKGFEALCGLYSKDCLDILKENIKKQKYKISDAFGCLDTEIISEKNPGISGIDSLNFFNINRTQDYDKFKDLWQDKKDSLNTNASFIEIWSDFFFR